MNKRPLAITIICWIFIVFGAIALLYGLRSSGATNAAQRIADLKGHWYVHVSRIAQVLCGVFMLYGFNWARWLLVVWIAFHIVISILHSPFQLLVHSVLFAVILYFLFCRQSSAYFRRQAFDG
jgi:hypothetical protein